MNTPSRTYAPNALRRERTRLASTRAVLLAALSLAALALLCPLLIGQAASSTSAQSTSCVAPPSGMVAWYPGDGNALDVQGGNNGSLQGGAAFAAGYVGQAFSFDGVNAWVETPGNNLLNSVPLSIDAWVKPEIRDEGPGFYPNNVVSNDNPRAFGHGFGVNVFSGGSQMAVEYQDGFREVPGVSFTAGQWYHVAVVYTTGNVKTYINGQMADDFSFTQGALDGASSMHIGKHNDDAGYGTRRFFKGLIDEVEVFNRAVSASEIQALVVAGSNGKCKPIYINPASLQGAVVGSPYNQIVTATYGTAPYSFSIRNGSLPPGLNLSNSGAISGMPQSIGTFSFTVRATDAAGQAGQRDYTISTFNCAPPPPGMVSWYPGDRNALDIQGGNDGSLQGGVTFAPGMVDQAFSFNGTNGFVQAVSAVANDPMSSGSQEAWVKFNQLPSDAGHIMQIIGKGGHCTDFDLQAEGDNRFHFYVACGNQIASTTVIQAGAWYHLAGTWDASGLRIYVNGQLEGTNPVSSLTRDQSGQPLEIGNQPYFGPRIFNGLIDEPQVFNRALTPDEVQAAYNAGSAGNCKSPSPGFCGEIDGQVKDPSAQPVAGALVQACERNNGPCAFNATTDANGNYSIRGLPLKTPFDLLIFPPQNSGNLPAELQSRIVQSCDAPLTGQDATLRAPDDAPNKTEFEPSSKDDNGRTTVYWKDNLTLTTHSCAYSKVRYSIQDGSGQEKSGDMEEDPPGSGSGNYTAEVPGLYPLHGPARVTIITTDCPDGSQSFDIYIDPSGVVLDTKGARVAGATVTLFRSDTGTGPFAQVPNGAAVMSPANRHNPDISDTRGLIGWDVLSGFYKVRAQKQGCHAPNDPGKAFVESGAFRVPPPVTDLVLTLDCPGTVNRTPPVLTVPKDVTVNTGAGAALCRIFVSDATLGTATASVAYGGVTIKRTGVPAGNLFRVGDATITYTATNDFGQQSSAAQIVHVIDNTPPVISNAAVDKPRIWPPNKKMVPVTITYSAADNCGGAVTAAITGITSNEPISASDAVIVDSHHVQLRADRLGSGKGRIYTITITATDSHGNKSRAKVTVVVPHDQGK